MKIEIYEKALCCETGVCGSSIDTELLRITSLVAELKSKGIDIERYNLSSSPERFINNSLISGRIKSGVDILPITVLDGKIIMERKYPTNAEFEALTGIALNKNNSRGGGCCSGCC